MNLSPSVCYLCRQRLFEPLSRDHVPPRQLYADGIRKKHHPNLLTIPVHDSCNRGYQFDEDYFVNTLVPYARGSYSGDALLQEIFQKYDAGEKRALVHKVHEEFERRPSGLILPPGFVAKRIDGNRVRRVAWKIIRGLYFHSLNEPLPEDTPNGLKVVPTDQPPPREFFALPDQSVRGPYPVFSTTSLRSFPSKQLQLLGNALLGLDHSHRHVPRSDL